MIHLSTAEKVIARAIFKGLAHSLFIPIIIIFTSVPFFQGWGLASGILYLFIPSIVYTRSNDKDISSIVFFGVLKAYLVFILLFAILLLS